MFKENWESRNIPEGSERGRGGIATKRISWGAIFAGVTVALVVQMVFSLLGLGLGMGAINPTAGNPLAGLGMGALIWWIASMLISLFIGGYVAGRLAGMPRNEEGILHGILTWSVFTLFSFYLITTAVGGVFNAVGNVISKGLTTAGSQVDPSEAKEKISQELEQRGISKEDLSKEEIQKKMDDPAMQQKAENVSSAASKAGIFGAIGLILGAIVSAIGGIVGRPKHLLQDVTETVKDKVYTKS